jgi:hypothetical protein
MSESAHELRGSIQALLAPGESILWIGRPDPRQFRSEVAAAFVSGLIPLSTGLAVLSIAILVPMGWAAPMFALLIGLLFSAAGLYLLSTPCQARRKLRRTIYALTDRRALVLDGVGWSGPSVVPYLREQCYEFGPEALASRSRRRRSARRTDLIFGEETHRMGGKGGPQELVLEIGFVGLAEPDAVEALLEQHFPRPALTHGSDASLPLVGASPSGGLAASLLIGTLLIAFLSPWFLMGAGLTAAGILALIDFRHRGELWFCLLPGLLLIGLVAFALYHFWQGPRRTIASFAFDGHILSYQLRSGGRHSAPAGEILSITERSGFRGRGASGWSIEIRGRNVAFLSDQITNATELVRLLRL